jgi:hypothetical protein
MVKKRRSSSQRNVTRGVFAFFWILLGGISAFYLFTVVTNPSARGDQTASTVSMGSPDETSGALPTGAANDTDLTEIKGNLNQLSQHVADIDARLKPIEKFVGPVAGLSPSTSVTTSPPSTPTESAPQPPAARAEAPIVKPETGKPQTEAMTPPAPKQVERLAENPSPKPTPSEQAKPTTETKPEPSSTPPAPAETAIANEPAPPAEPQPVVSAPFDDEPAEEDNSAPPPAAAGQAQAPAAASAGTQAAKPEETEIAHLDPVTLPPAANDGSTRYGIEIGVVDKKDALRPLWRAMLSDHAALVAGLQPRRVLAPDKKWRLIAGPFANAQEAEAACALFKKASKPCAATVFAGDSL